MLWNEECDCHLDGERLAAQSWWHNPRTCSEEMFHAQRILRAVLAHQLEALAVSSQFISHEASGTEQQLHCSLNILNSNACTFVTTAHLAIMLG